MMKKNIILIKSIEFALSIIELSSILEGEKHYAIANQIIQSGTSIGANICEAQNAESKDDFIHKLKISAKEANETEFWLLICHLSAASLISPALYEDFALPYEQKVCNAVRETGGMVKIYLNGEMVAIHPRDYTPVLGRKF